MRFISAKDLRNRSGKIWKDLESAGEIVLTLHGHPVALITRLTEKNFESEIRAMRRARADLALARMRESARRSGMDRMSYGEIDEIVREARKSRKRRKK